MNDALIAALAEFRRAVQAHEQAKRKLDEHQEQLQMLENDFAATATARRDARDRLLEIAGK